MPAASSSSARPLPSSGLTNEQLQGVFGQIGLPAIFYGVNDLPVVPGGSERRYGTDATPPARLRPLRRRDHRERILRTACVYLNSGFPVVVITKAHAFTLVGWQRRDGKVELIACDDSYGPYERIRDPLTHGDPWEALMIPVPEKIFLSGAAAEKRAIDVFRAEADRARAAGQRPLLGQARRRPRKLSRKRFSVRTQLIEGRVYKAGVNPTQRDTETAKVVRLAHLPHWVWLVELHERRLREAGKPCVIAEVVLSSTSHDEAPVQQLIATRSLVGDADEFRRLAAVGRNVRAAHVEREVPPWETMITSI